MFLPPVFATLKASADVRAFVQTGSDRIRIWRHDSAPQDERRPYITWVLVGDEPANELSDVPGIDRYSVQVDCWHPEDAGCEALAEAVRDCIEPVAHMTGVVINGRDTATKLFRLGLQFDFWTPRT